MAQYVGQTMIHALLRPSLRGARQQYAGQFIDPYALGQQAEPTLDALSAQVDPYYLGQQAGQRAASALDPASQAYQDQLKRAADLLKEQQVMASGSAKTAASGLSGTILLGVGVLALVWIWRTK